MRTVLPDRVLSKMSPADRKHLGAAGMTADEAQAKIEVRSESDLQKLINNELRRKGLPFLWNRTDKRNHGTIGQPDFTIFCHGKLLLMEIKHGKGKLSQEQVALHAQLAEQGFQVHVVTSFEQAHFLIKEASL